MAGLFRLVGTVADVAGISGCVGLVYLLLRGRRRLSLDWRKLCAVVLLPLLYCSALLVFGLLGWKQIHERYLRPAFPLLAVLAGAGFACLAKDIKKNPYGYALLGTALAVMLIGALHPPLRDHRHPQTELGRRLRRHDPDYDGFVISDYSQPVYYAGMRYLPTGWPTRRFFSRVASKKVKYFILEHPEEATGWERKLWEYTKEHNCPEILYEQQREIHVYRNALYCGGSPKAEDKQSGVREGK